jgi:hypothetical protein
MLGVGATEVKPLLQATDRDVQVVLDVLLGNALVEEALQLVRRFRDLLRTDATAWQVRWCRRKTAKLGTLHAIFVPSLLTPDASAVFTTLMEYCRTNDRSWMDWLLKQHYYEEEQVRWSVWLFQSCLIVPVRTRCCSSYGATR